MVPCVARAVSDPLFLLSRARCPREQGHYGFMLTDLYLYPLLSGQKADIHKGQLHIDPVFKAPYTLPILLTGCMATISATSATGSTSYTLTVVFGELHISAAGGLVVSGSAFPSPVHLDEGESVNWQR